MVLLFYATLILAACAVIAALADMEGRRQRRRRIARLKERRAFLDSLEPKRWMT